MMRSLDHPHDSPAEMNEKESARAMSRSQKALELRKYYSPADAEAGEDVNASFNERINADGALTSYAENALWRLGASRCMVSLIDRDTQYFIAGASRRNSFEVEVDTKWFDNDHITVSGGPCEHVIELPEDSDSACFVVEDLAASPEYSNLPMVNGEKGNYRFYAGAPITTNLGVNIGSFCVFGDSPRSGGLTLKQKKYMGSLAASVMSHLEIHREAAERKRVSLMSKGIANFLEKTSRVTDPNYLSDENSAQSRLDHQQHTSPSDDGDKRQQDQSANSHNKEASHVPIQTLDRIKITLDHAAEILKEALELTIGGVVFLDVKRGFRQTDVTDAFDDSRTDLGAVMDEQKECDDGSDKMAKRPTITQSSQAQKKARPSNHASHVSYSRNANEEANSAKVLAMAVADTAKLDRSSSVMDGKTLQTFMNSYPQGNVWYIDEEGHFSSLEQVNNHEESKENESSRGKMQQSRKASSTNVLRQRAEASLLTKVFEGARQIIFVPLWDAGSDRWFSGCFVWSKSAVPVFTVDSEISFLSAFTNSLMVEISRLDAITANKMKSDFISSISHEFRSPLHGILASAEFLQESKLEASQSEFVTTIQNCGSTLLDTINHVLDYSKINSFEKATSEGTISNELHCTCNIALLCEEIVNGMMAAGEYQGTQHSRVPSGTNTFTSDNLFVRDSSTHKRAVEVILDFEHRDWNFTIQPGAFRRVVMNIFGNAQKYTPSGVILVQLKAQEVTYEDRSPKRRSAAKEGRPSHMVIINIIDSGRGMSTDYMERKLFTPFAQEDSLSVGVGLGLSIVRSIVAQLDGQIQIRSEIGKGTDVEISVPLYSDPDKGAETEKPHDQEHTSLQETRYSFDAINKLARGRSVAIWTQSNVNEGGTKSVSLNCLRRYCSEWFNFTVTNLKHLDDLTKADLVIAEEQDSGTQDAKQSLLEHANRLLLIRNTSIWVKDDKIASFGKSHASIHAPVGPFKLARSIISIFDTDDLDDKHSVSTNATAPCSDAAIHNEPTEVNLADGPSVKVDVSSDKSSASDSLTDANSSLARPSLLPSNDVHSLLSIGSVIEVGATKSNNLTLPVRLSSQRSISEPAPRKPLETQGEPYVPLRLLAVDDNDVNLQLICRFLKKRKSDIIVTARNGSEAVDAVKRLHTSSNGTQQFDIIFMDISMPVMDGFEATASIREFESQIGTIVSASTSSSSPPSLDGDNAKNTLIVALTGLGSKRDRDRAEECGFSDFITKPVSFKKVGDLIQRVSKEISSRTSSSGAATPPTENTS